MPEQVVAGANVSVKWARTCLAVLRLSLIASDDVQGKAVASEAESKSRLPAMVIHSGSPNRETNEC
jgi:hypothetical protein